MHAVITENDESQWHDQTGIAYHFLKRALMLLNPGMQVVYYKEKLKDKRFAAGRLSPEMHYFGSAEIAKKYIPIHRKKDRVLSVEELRTMISEQ